MSKKNKIQDLLEAHLDKVVLGAIILVSLYLLWTLVLGNPYGAPISGRKLGPGEIDLRNRREAGYMTEMLDEPMTERMPYDQRLVAEFDASFRSTLPTIASKMTFPIPGTPEQVADEDRLYPVPEIAALSEVQVTAVRGAVHKATEEIGPDTPYSSVATELGDLDLVTVSGRFDVQALFRNYQQSFMGPRLNAAWRDPTYAKPIFARVELQRRQKLADGTWGDWQIVPPTQIDPYRRLISQTPMTVTEMEFGGVSLWSRQYDDPRVQINVLQPQAYDFASLQTPWLPPKFLDEAQTILKRQKDEQLRKDREERAKARSTREDTLRGGGAGDMMLGGGGRPGGRQEQPRGRRDGGGGQENMEMMMPGMMPAQPGRTAAAARRERTVDDVLKDMQRERLTDQTKLESLRDPMLVWAHDDTPEPGQTYQYRIRVGAFNPIAGRNWFGEGQQQNQNQTIFFGPFSEPTKEVVIPRMIHIFPTDVLARDSAGGVKVEVARYYLGQWRTREFEVFPGQVIGQKVDLEPAAGTAGTPAAPALGLEMMGGAGGGEASAVAQTVDFTTPFMMVDINSLIEWGAVSNPVRKEMSQMLYYGPDKTLAALAIGKTNWSSMMRREYTDIKEAEQNAPTLNTSRTATPGTMPTDGMMPGMPGMPGGMPGGPMMQDMMY